MKRKRSIKEQATPNSPTPKRARPQPKVQKLGNEVATGHEGSQRDESSASDAEANILEATRAEVVTPRGKHKLAFATPTKPYKVSGQVETSTTIRNADRSARRKSVRNIIERQIAGDLSDENEFEEEENNLAKRIWDEQREEDESAEDDQAEEDELPPDKAAIPETPSKRGRGRPKGSLKKRSPTPPPDLPPHEQYFYHNRPGALKSSSNTLSSFNLLTHASYHTLISAHTDPHTPSIAYLHSLHSRSFPQWAFELSQSFSICLYGYGSKRNLLYDFAAYLHSRAAPSPPAIVIINGDHPALSLRALLTTIATTLFPKHTKLPSQPPLLLSQILGRLSSHPPTQPITLLLFSISSPTLRRQQAQAALASLASNPHLHLLATAEGSSFPLLWDTPTLARFNFAFHDATTFVPYDDGSGTAELGGVVDSVAELMGRKDAGVRGRDGVRWVLRSLTEKARGLYRVLIEEVLAGADGAIDGAADAAPDSEDEGDGFAQPGGKLDEKGRAEADMVVEFKTLYAKAVEEFLCSSEMDFRGLLKEFVDHRMVVVVRDRGGREVLGVPLRREEMEGVLEDLMG